MSGATGDRDRRRATGRWSRRWLSLSIALLAVLSMGFEWEGRLARLRRDLETGDVARRREVVRLLASYPARRVSEPLLLALGDPDATVRAEAADAVGRVRLREAVPHLLEWLDDSEADVRASATRALGRIADERTVPSLVRALGDANTDVRSAAVVALAAIGSPEVAVPLLGRLDDQDAGVRSDAAEALGQLADPRAVVPLIGRARDPAPEVRTAVYGALGALGDERAVPALVQALRDDNEEVQLAAIAALGQVGSEGATDALVGLLSRPDPRTSRAVLSALGAIGGERAISALVEALADQQTRETAGHVLLASAIRRRTLAGEEAGPPEDARRIEEALAEALDSTASHLHATAIAEVLSRLAEELPGTGAACAPALLRALRDRRGTPAAVMRALAASGSPDGLVPLLEQLRSEDPTITMAVLDALDVYFRRNPADGRAADPLLAALGRVAPSQRPKVIRLLGRVGAARALPALRPLLEHGSDDVRLAAVEAIGRIGDPGGAPALLRLLEDRDGQTRYQAARALAAAASAETVGDLLDLLQAEEPTDRQAVLVALGGALARLHGSDGLPAAVAARARTVLAGATRSEDLSLASAALDALGRTGDPEAAAAVIELLDSRYPVLRRQAALTLGAFDADGAREALRAALGSSDPSIVAAAAAALGEHGEAEDGPRLVETASRGRWPASAAAAFGLARLARRDLLAAELAPSLCELTLSRDAYVRANLAIAFAAMEAPPCADGPDPSDWLTPRHSAAVRGAAVRWLGAAARAGRTPVPAAEAVLAQCAERDLAPEVVAVCRDPALAPLDDEADVFAYGADGRTLLADRLVALRLSDGSVLVARTDANGHLRLRAAPRGPLRLDDPLHTPLEP